MKTWILAGGLSLLLGGAALRAQEATGRLEVGDPAPVLDHVSWIKGGPVAAWEPGHIYVLDFWATWCGPCKASIPHLDALARKHAGNKVTVIGPAVWPRPGMVPTREFVEQKGDAMSYLIAEDIDNATSDAFMRASGSDGIPTAMVIGRDGKLVYIGHPLFGLVPVVNHLVAGDFDPAKMNEYEQEAKAELAAAQKPLDDLMGALSAAKAEKDWAKAADVSDRILALDPSGNGRYGVFSYQYRKLAGDADGAASYGRKLADETFLKSSDNLNMLAWLIVDPQSDTAPDQRDLDLALLAGQRADELTGHDDPNVLDTVARVHFLRGDVGEALALQEKAVNLATNDELKAELQVRLDEYRGARGQG